MFKNKKILWGVLFLLLLLVIDFFWPFLPFPGTYGPIKEPIPIMGHRGAGELAPENTNPAIDSALTYKVKLIEIDVQRTKDGVIILMHDETVNRTTNGKGQVKDLTWDYIKGLDAGSYFSSKYSHVRVPTLESALLNLKQKDATATLVIEVKDPDEFPGIGDELIALINELDMKEQAMIISFDKGFIKALHASDKALQLGALYKIPPKSTAEELAFVKVVSVFWPGGSVFFGRVKKIQAKDVEVWVWTVNKLKRMKRLQTRGFDGIVTDYPNLPVMGR